MGWWNSLFFDSIFWKSIILLLFCSISSLAAVEINEVMYAPTEYFGGQYNEWVELFNSGNESVNLSTCFLDSKKVLSKLVIPPQDYFIVARNTTLFSNNYSYDGAIIEQSLSFKDKADTIILNGTCSSQLDYNFSLGNPLSNNNRDRTLERSVNGSWGESIVDGGSPGKKNSINNFESDPKPIPDNITTNSTTNLTTNSTTNISLPVTELCNISLSLSGDPIINGTKLNFTITAENLEATPINITIKGKIETINGEIIKEYSPWTDHTLSKSIQKKYSPTVDEGVYLVTFYVENSSCGDNNPDNSIQKLFVKRSTPLPLQNSTLTIDSITLGSDKKARWGDQLPIRLSIYKGNESKSEVKVWAEDIDQKVSKTTSFLLPERNHLSTLTIPLQLDSNCNQKINADHILVITEAFGLRTEKEILIGGISSELCKTITVEKSVLTSSTTSSSSTTPSKSRAASISLDVPSSIAAGEVLPVTVHLKGTTSKKKFTLSGYAYRGRTCYSCFNRSRDQDVILKTITLDKDQEQDQEILLKMDQNIDEGILKVKIKMTQEGLKTPKEAIAETYILPAPKAIPLSTSSTRNLTTPLLSSPPPNTPPTVSQSHSISEKLPTNPGIVIYESTSAKTKKSIPYFLIAAFALLSVSLIFRRK